MTLEQSIEKTMSSFEPKGGLDTMIYSLVLAASRYFTECPDDFSLQAVGYRCVVFGGTNRLLWTAEKGFLPDRPYCTENFLRRCASLGDLPRGQ
jgi:hypothetical protein